MSETKDTETKDDETGESIELTDGEKNVITAVVRLAAMCDILREPLGNISCFVQDVAQDIVTARGRQRALSYSTEVALLEELRKRFGDLRPSEVRGVWSELLDHERDLQQLNAAKNSHYLSGVASLITALFSNMKIAVFPGIVETVKRNFGGTGNPPQA